MVREWLRKKKKSWGSGLKNVDRGTGTNVKGKSKRRAKNNGGYKERRKELSATCRTVRCH